MLDITTHAEEIFSKSPNLELKRLVLKFVFESIYLIEGKLSYKLKFPFNEFIDLCNWKNNVTKVVEPICCKENQGLQVKNNSNVQIGLK